MGLVVLGLLTLTYVPAKEAEGFTHLESSPILDMWYRWDAGFYTAISLYGYHWQVHHYADADTAFMPFYPMLIRGANRLIIGCVDQGCTSSWLLKCEGRECATISGLLISNVALMASIFILFSLTCERFGKTTAYRASWLLMLSPISVFLSGIYTESTFLLLTLLVFYAISKNKFALALIPAGFASITRTVGIAMTLPLLLYALGLSGTKRVVYAGLSLLPVFIFIGYISYIGKAAGDPLAYFHSNTQLWDRTISGPWEILTAYIGDQPTMFWGGWPAWIDLIFAVFWLVVAYITLKEDISWGLFSLAGISIPAISGILVGMPRFGAVLFPFYIVIAKRLDRVITQVLGYSISAACGALFLVRFVSWRFIA